jgi:hypothetical protein
LEISAARFTATVVLPERAATFATLITARISFSDSLSLVSPTQRPKRADARLTCSRAALKMVETALW